MARPTRRVIASGIAAWDADTDENFSKVFDAPFPMYLADSLVDLTADFDPADYEQCKALVGEVEYISDGVDWVESLVSGEAANVPASTATTVSQMASDFNDLLTALKGSTPPLMASS